MPRASSNTKSKKQLVEENEELRKELKSIKTPKSKKFARGTGSWVLIVIATLLLMIGNIFFWTSSTIVNNQRYINAVGPIIKQPSVQTALASYTTDQIFANNNVQGYVSQVLPPRASFLAPQLTSQLKGFTDAAIKKVISHPKFQEFWIATLTKTHNAVINIAKNYKGNGTVTVNDVYSQLTSNLSGTKLSFLANKQLPSKVSSIQIATVAWLPALSTFINNLTLYKILAIALFVILSFLAVYISRNRRKAVIKLSLSVLVGMLATLLALKLAKVGIVNSVASQYSTAVGDSYDIVFKAFMTQVDVIGLVALVVALIAWATGPFKSASYVRGKSEAVLSGQAHSMVFHKENTFTLYIGQHKKAIMITLAVIIALLMLFISLTPSLIIVYLVILVIALGIVEFLAAKKNSKR
ncbi:MAG TPA: hypothetical protein VL989_01995 [Candidatus Sulfotelmatobacter sp.]|nr:hypothetical protein [Candidatus Sulfotelmatobacter sp.]